jgi:Mg-chelatase subunit ChlD
LIVFGNAAYLQAPFTDDLRDLAHAARHESEVAMAGPSTALGDAIGLAIALFQDSKTDNRVLIVLTDGNDTGSRVPPDRCSGYRRELRRDDLHRGGRRPGNGRRGGNGSGDPGSRRLALPAA